MANAKVAMITGASRGIGLATARTFAKAGFKLAITARSNKTINAVAEELRNIGTDVLPIAMDLLDFDSINAAVKKAISYYGGVDVLINNAIYQGQDLNHGFMQLSTESLERALRGNVIAPFLLTQTLLPHLIESQKGMVINVTSGAGETNPGIPFSKGGWGFAYGASKGALSRMSGIINVEHRNDGVLALTVNPGVVLTETMKATIGAEGKLASKLGAVEPEVPAAALLWLATDDEAMQMTGRTIELQEIARSKNL